MQEQLRHEFPKDRSFGSSTSSSPLQAAKWLDYQALIDEEEMVGLFDQLGPFSLYYCGTVCKPGEGEIEKNAFLDHYRAYVHCLREGTPPDQFLYRRLFSPAMTVTPEVLFAIQLGDGRQIIRVSKPVVQLQAHCMNYSIVDKKFHPMVFGTDSISWGIQFSYPQLYQDNMTKEVRSVTDTPDFPNTPLFRSLQKWMRQYTIPAPFVVDGVLTNVPMRLGKKCLSWIDRHPHLKQKGITVKK